MEPYKTICESAGAHFVAVENGSVYFADPRDGTRLSLYAAACRTAYDIELALKAHREPIVGFDPLLPTNARMSR